MKKILFIYLFIFLHFLTQDNSAQIYFKRRFYNFYGKGDFINLDYQNI